MSNTTARRHSPGLYEGQPTTPVAERASKKANQAAASYQDRRTDELAQGQPRTTQSEQTEKLRQPQLRQGQGIHPLFYIGLTLLAIWLAWVATTAGAAWVVTHWSDPSQFGPLRGSIVTGVFGGGDSAAHPSKLIGWNDSGHVRIIFAHSNDANHTQIVTGPNLVVLDFPDPTGAEIDLQTGNFPDANGNRDSFLDLRIHILSSTFDTPFHRYEQVYTLYGDGNGNLSAQPPSANSGNGNRGK